MEASFETTLNNAIKLVKNTEQRIVIEKLDKIEFCVTMNVGLISLSKKINSE